MCPPSNSYGYRQSMTLNEATDSLNSPRTSLAMVCTEIDFKSLCFPSVSGKQNGRLKSPIKSVSDEAGEENSGLVVELKMYVSK